MTYQLGETTGSYRSVLSRWKAIGRKAYAYMTVLVTPSGNSIEFYYVYINIDRSVSPYNYRSYPLPKSSTAYLKQLTEKGGMGYRPKDVLVNHKRENFQVYIRDTGRPSAKYIYRHMPCVKNLTEFYNQLNQQAAQGYLHIGSRELNGRCSVYMKDTSQKSKFIYGQVPRVNSTAQLASTANTWGAKGYRYASYQYITIKSGNSSDEKAVFLYYRDTTQKSCTFSYRFLPTPSTLTDSLTQLSDQAALGSVLAGTVYFYGEARVTIYMTMRNCQYEAMNIDSIYY